MSGSRTAKLRTQFEFSVLLNFHAVIEAESEKEAREKIDDWEKSWIDQGEFIGVSDVELFDIRENEETK